MHRIVLCCLLAALAPLAAHSVADTRPVPRTEASDRRATWNAAMREAEAALTAGDVARGERALRRALATAGREDAPRTRAALAEVLVERDGDEAVTLYRQALASCPDGSPEALAVRDGLARALALRGRWSEAGTVLEEALRARECAGDADGVALTAALLADVRRAEGRAADAEALYGRALTRWETEGATRGAEIAAALHGRALARMAGGDLAAACADLSRAVALIEAAAGAEAIALAAPLADHAVALAEAGRDAEAGAAFTRALALIARHAGADAPEQVPVLQARARWHAAHARWDEALADGERQATLSATVGATAHADALDGLIALCVAAGRSERARELGDVLASLTSHDQRARE